ncbi:MAG: FAD:protein FMN transferase [Dehalococcoidia bacterium]|nr:FAD:protein FMN transferase [Dehalococcoidia bacterium]
MAEHWDSFRAMNTEIDVSVVSETAPSDAFLNVRLLFERQEERFSRFRESSLLSQLNRGAEVEDATFARCCRMALEASELTAGLFNPMVLPALRAAGYDRTFEQVSGGQPVAQDVPDPRQVLALDGDRVRLRAGQMDLGGIVKGWTVDLAIEALSSRYPDLFLNAGGDLRCEGSEENQPDGWLVAVEGLPGEGDAWQGVMTGSLATSTSLKRRWRTEGGGEAHHLVDPRTGLPGDSPFVQVSAWEDETWRAEVWAKAILIGGVETAERAASFGVEVLAIGRDGITFER